MSGFSGGLPVLTANSTPGPRLLYSRTVLVQTPPIVGFSTQAAPYNQVYGNYAPTGNASFEAVVEIPSNTGFLEARIAVAQEAWIGLGSLGTIPDDYAGMNTPRGATATPPNLDFSSSALLLTPYYPLVLPIDSQLAVSVQARSSEALVVLMFWGG